MKSSPGLAARPASEPSPVGSRRRARVVAEPPTLEEADRRLAAARGRPQPWLTPEALEAARGLPVVVGPKVYRKP